MVAQVGVKQFADLREAVFYGIAECERRGVSTFRQSGFSARQTTAVSRPTMRLCVFSKTAEMRPLFGLEALHRKPQVFLYQADALRLVVVFQRLKDGDVLLQARVGVEVEERLKENHLHECT